MKIPAVALMLLSLHDAAGFLPANRGASAARRSFGLRMSTERDIKTLNATEVASSQLRTVLTNSAFKGFIKDAEKQEKVSGANKLFNMVRLDAPFEPNAQLSLFLAHCRH